MVKFVYSSGVTYEGDFQDAIYHGVGILTKPGHWIHNGEFKDGLPDGQGIRFYPDGKEIDGEWYEGVIDI